MEKHHKFSIWYVLIAIWIVLILQHSIAQTFRVQQISYSDFLKGLQDGRVTEVAVTQDRIQGKIKAMEDGREKARRTGE